MTNLETVIGLRNAPNVHRQPAYQLGASSLLLAVLVILAALGFEHILGYRPCELCLLQRWPYYLGIPVIFLGLIMVAMRESRLAALLLGAAALGFLFSTALGIYHAGVEWHFWAGPVTCGGKLGKLDMSKLGTEPLVQCDEASWRFLGLSFAGWNVVVSIGLAIALGKAAQAARDAEAPETAL